MRYLLDTCSLIWALTDDPKLPEDIKDIICDLDNTIYVSTISLLEIALKQRKYKDFYNPREIATLCQRSGYIFVELGVESILNLNSLKIKDGETINNDPFDRLIVSQSVVKGYTLLSHDNVLKHYDYNNIFIY